MRMLKLIQGVAAAFAELSSALRIKTTAVESDTHPSLAEVFSDQAHMGLTLSTHASSPLQEAEAQGF